MKLTVRKKSMHYLMIMADLKEEILSIMGPIFGDGLKEQLSKNFESDKPQEIVKVAHQMLSDYLGEEAADELLGKIVKRFPNLKLELH